MQTFCTILLVCYFVTARADEGTLSFEMSVAPLFDHGFNVNRATAILTSENHQISKELAITRTKVDVLFENVPANTQSSLDLLLFEGSMMIARGSGIGVVSPGQTTSVSGRIDIACDKVILIIDWNSENPPKTTEDFLDFSIDPQNYTLKLYEGLQDFAKLASDYAENSMPWFYPNRVWSHLDSNMVPIVDYSFGSFRNPVTTSQTAFAFYNQYLETNDPVAKQGFLNNAQWLLENHDSNWYFRYEFDFRHSSAPTMAKGWISAMAQGEALGVVSIAFHLTGEQKYLGAAQGIFKTLHTNSDSLWCIGIDDEEYYWLEEYPTIHFCHVLNGKLFALWGLWNYYVVTGDEFALALFKAGIKTIVDHYSTWNVQNSNSSYYCQHKPILSNYHKIHLLQLRSYADFFDIPEFRDAAACLSNNIITSIEMPPEPDVVPFEFVLHQNYPNPFNASTTISFTTPERALINLTIYNELGQFVEELINQELSAGNHKVRWNASNYSSGIYFYVVRSRLAVLTGRMILLK